MFKAVCFGALLALSSAGLAQTDAGAPAAKPVKQKLSCRRSGNTGTRLPSPSTCHTADQWAAIDRQHEDDAQRSLDGQRSFDHSVNQTPH